jgi:hypothetical protein
MTDMLTAIVLALACVHTDISHEPNTMAYWSVPDFIDTGLGRQFG